MNESRFRFLANDFPGLYEICVRAEQESEYNVAMMQIRRAMETMIGDLGARNRELFRGINELEEKQLFDRDTSRRFHAFRRMVNQGDGQEAPGLPSCLDQLLILSVAYGLQRGKAYGVERFSLDDVSAVRRYLAEVGKLPEEPGYDGQYDNSSIDPLRLANPIQAPETARQEPLPLSRRDFETPEDFEQRIAAMDPVYIGCAILDTRRKDGYTDVNFLVHHIDHNPDIRFSPVSALYTTGVTAEKVIDGELFAKLKVHDDNICCDYSQVYLHDGDDAIAVRPIYWDTFSYENDEDYKDRIRSMPLLPFGIGTVDSRESDLETGSLSVVINPFQYAETVMENLLSPNKKITIQCNSDMAKKLCDGPMPCLLFVKLHDDSAAAKSVLWRNDVGIIVERDYRDEMDWWKKGADQGYAPAQYNLGYFYYNGVGVEQDHRKSVEWTRKAAEQGHAEAQFELGYFYYNGIGVEQDSRKFVEWARKAAEQGYVGAQFELGHFYYNGIGVEQDYRKAVEWYQKAAEQGDAEAQYELGKCYYNGNGVDKDYRKSVEWTRKAAEQGYAEAQFGLGYFYYNGIGVEQDYRKAVEWYRKAAEQGDAEAQTSLGNCYSLGKGVEQDYRQAAAWYRKAAEQDYARAQVYLGRCYFTGEGVEQDYQKAVEWYRKAAEQGHKRAQFYLGNCYFDGEGIEQDCQKAVEWYRKAAEQGMARAQFNLGVCYSHGIGIEQDGEQARYWFEKATVYGENDENLQESIQDALAEL